MVQRDFKQNYHCIQLNLLYLTSNTIKLKFSKQNLTTTATYHTAWL